METVKEKLAILFNDYWGVTMTVEELVNVFVSNGVTIATDTDVGDKLVKTRERENCPMRHENGNCLPAGGFCTAVNDPICDALHNAYENGRCSVATDTNDKWVSVDERKPEKDKEYIVVIEGAKRSTHLYFDGEAWFSEYGDVYKVLYWMELPPLPQPPKGVQQ